MKRVAAALFALALVPLWATPPAGAASAPITISGTMTASKALGDLQIRSCPESSTAWCQDVPVEKNGEFSFRGVPGPWRIELSGGQRHLNWQLQQTVTLDQSAEWHLVLPELVEVEVVTRSLDGEPVPRHVGGYQMQSADPVELSPDLPAFEASHAFSRRTSASGRTTVAVLPDSALDLPVTEEAQTGTYRLALDTPTRTSLDAGADTLVKARDLPRHNVSVGVRDATGRSVGTEVRLQGLWGTTSAAGGQAVPFPDGDVVAQIDSREHLWPLPSKWRVSQPFTVDGDEALSLTLPETVKVAGSVHDSVDGSPVEGAIVHVDGETDAQLHPGLPAATLSNGFGTYSPLSSTSKADGSFQLRAFPGDNVGAVATFWDPGVYRTTPRQSVGQAGGPPLDLELPEPALVTLDFATFDGTPIVESRAWLVLSQNGRRRFVPGPDGRLQLLMSPGHTGISVKLGDPEMAFTRDVEVTGDVMLEMRTRDPVDVDALVLSSRGYAATRTEVRVAGITMVDTETEPVSARYAVATETDRDGHAVTALLPTTDAVVVALGGYRARMVDLTADRAMVLAHGYKGEGTGVPYVLFDPVEAVGTEATFTSKWEAVDADGAAVRRVVTLPTGTQWFDDRYEGPLSGLAPWVRTQAAMGATTCMGAAGSLGGYSGPMSVMACRTRPVDDASMQRVGRWKRVNDGAAYGGNLQRTSRRGAMLVMDGLNVPRSPRVGSLSLLARTAPDAGVVRLRIGPKWVSRRVSLEGPSGATSVFVPIRAERRNAPLQGKLRVIVVSEGRPVQIDGVTIPTAPRGYPFSTP